MEAGESSASRSPEPDCGLEPAPERSTEPRREGEGSSRLAAPLLLPLRLNKDGVPSLEGASCSADTRLGGPLMAVGGSWAKEEAVPGAAASALGETLSPCTGGLPPRADATERACRACL